MSDLSLDRAIRLPADVKSLEPRADAVVDAYPLTTMQAAMLFHGRREPGFYVQQYVCTLHEPLRAPDFRRAWERLFARHPVLRTSILLDATPEPLQRVHAGVELPWSERDWRHLPPAAREEALRAFLREDRATPFRPEDAPLARLALFRLAEEEYRLVWTSHHALLDGHARRILLREVFDDYAARLDGREPAPAERRSFGEYVRWLRDAEAPDSRTFWEEELRGFQAPNEVVVEGDGGEPGRRERHALELPEELGDALRELARSRAVTLNTVLQGAWALLLGRYTGDHDVVFGATRMCRGGGFAGAEGVVGLLSNTVPVRVRLDDADSVADLLKRVRARWVRIRPHERTHLARIQEWRGAPGGAPLFQTALSFETESAREGLHRLGDAWRRRAFDLVQWVANPLTIVACGGPRITLEVLYDPSRFGGEAVGRMGEHLTRVLRAFADDPGQPLGRIEILSPAERRRLVETLNPPAAPEAGGASIPALLQARAAGSPDAVAVVFGDQALTYGELDRRSSQLARALRRRGVGVETRVGVCMERSLELVIALAAILKAGGAYVALDPESPPDRLRFVLDDAGVSHLLCHGHLAGRLPAGGPAPLAADPLWAQAAGEDAGPVAVAVEPRGLAYVAYTSGSTGTPKGVGVEHRGVVRLVRGASYAALGPDEVVLHAAPLSFDASTLEVWGALLNGARLVLAPAATPTLEELGRTIVRHGVTTLWLTAGLFRAMVEAQLEAFAGVRQLLAGGDVVPAAEVERVRRRFPALRLINGYGPTENTTFTCCHTVPAAWDGGPLPIGTPIAGTQVYLLDGALRPLPEGVPGELYAGGAGVARGYLGRPGATAERFLPDPFSGEAGARMYRTGDRARWRAGGVLEFLGRLDGQVKIRGFRVEPGEVEAALLRHPEVRECAVAAREDAAGERRLVAYVAGGAGADELRGHLRRILPEHMLPAAFVALDRLPLTTNGKVDRGALPAPEAGGAAGRYVAPRTPVEEVLAEVWAEVLGVERVGVEESFFELGGHSLLAMAVLSRVRSLLGAELPVRAVFDGPTVAEMAERVEALRRAGLPAPAPVRPAARGGAAPLSFAQERLWFIHRMDPESAAYNVPVFRRLEGPLDVEALARALGEVVRRHEALRTTFAEVDGAPAQRIAPPGGFVLPVEDLSGLGEAEREAALARRAAEEAARPFDLRAGPVLRAALLRLGAESHALLLCMHHVATDEWSIGILFRELAALYGAYREGRGSPLAEPAVQYADHAAWERARLRGEALEGRLAWWRERLAGAPEVLELPADRPRPAARSHRGARERLDIPAELEGRLRALGRSEGATPFMVLLGAFQVLLSRWTGTRDVVVGSPVAGRTRGEAEGVIGFFANMLALRTDLDGDPSFREVLRRVREATLGAYDHQDVPFERLVAELRPGRSLGHSPLFQVTLTLENGERSGGGLPGLRVEPLEAETGAAKFDLSLIVSAAPRGGLRGELVYAADLFEPATIRRMAAQLARVLEEVPGAADAPISHLRLLDGAERGALLAAGGAARRFPVSERVERRFEMRAAERPDAVAVTFEGSALTYREVNERANRLARRLRALGVGPGTRVGIALERSAGLVISILAVLKAGGAYVPLDPSYPADRIAFVLEDAGIPVLVTTSDLLPRLPSFAGAALCVDADADAIAAESGENPEVEAGPDSVAYVIYTSGSTGRPKGVEVTHANVVRLFDATDEWFGFGAGDVWTLFHSCAFDFSVWEIWGALLYGGRLVVVPFLTTRSPEDFHRLLVDEGVTVLSQTPSAFKQLIQADLDSGVDPSALGLRFVVFGGEALDPRALGAWMERHGDDRPRLVNMYGITETTVHVTYRVITREDLDRGGSPIGVPIPDLSLYVLDERLEPVPPGVAGELFVGGAGVARGYLDRPELTAERFVRDPFSADPAARLYRSGDLARRRADGELEYLGRADQQVKLRGFRIETGEIEAALASHPAVAAAAVVARDDAGGERRLVAYVVAPAGAAAPSAAELRARLAETLPDYMVPAAFVALDALPLTENGKLDRRALPAPEEAEGAVAADAYVAPRTPAEVELAEVYREVLGVERVGVDDNYFALGGDSIRSVLLVAAARRRGLQVSIRQLHRHQTVRDLAAAAGFSPGAPAPLPEPAAQPFALLDPAARAGLPADVEDAYPVSQVQLGMLYHTERDPASRVYHEVIGFRVRTRFDEAALREALRRLAARHPVLRTSFDLAARPEPVQRVHRHVEIPLEVTDLRTDPAGADGWMEREKGRGFDWTAPPLLRFRAHLLADDAFRLVLVEHHVVLDGWSVATLMTELLRLYLALRDGAADPNGTPPAARFRDLVALERQAAASAESRAFWRRVVDGAPEAALPPREGSGAPRPDDAPHLWLDVPAGVAEGVARAAAGAGVPLKTVLLAVHLRVLALLSAAEEVATGYVTSGRPETEDGERVLGVFLNTVPLRARAAGGTWGELVRRTWAAEEALLPHRRFPLSEIVREAGGRTPFETAFNFVHFHVYEALAAGGVALEREEFFQKTEVPLLANFQVSSATGALGLRLEYDPARLGEAQVSRIAGWYRRALEGAAAAEPGTPLSRLPLLGAEEREALLAAGGATRRFPVSERVERRFEARAAERPDAVAVTFEGSALTYREVNGRANRLARRLRALGVGPETRVGIALERSAELVISILAVLKAGGAYVPLDPAYPADRIAFVLEDAGIPVLVTTSDLLPRLPSFAGAALCIDADAEAIAAENGENPEVEAGPDSVAYVIYTSGSTGRPKGVEVTHANVVRLFDATDEWFGFGADDVWTLFHSCAFDFSVWEIWGALLYGGRLVVVPFLTTRSPEDFHRLLVDEGVTVLSQTPSAFKQLVQADLASGADPRDLRLRFVVFGGEALDPRALGPWMERHGDDRPRLVNMYGITETTVHVTYRVITREDLDRGGSPIGVPIPDLSLHVLDSRLEPVPPGVAGELFVGGAGVARGYLDRPELTAERFVRDPFSDDPAARLYRSGDLARRRADGELEYLGRADQQVKVRGFRVETGEIEAALVSHPAVAAAAVVAREEPSGEKQLVAFVVLSPGAAEDPAGMRAALAGRLPDYMVPASFVVLPELPLTENGKLDRRALLAPGAGRLLRPAYAAPESEPERVLQEAWEEVVGAERVGVLEDFFAAGGDSIRAVQLVAVLRQRGMALTVRDLFERPTIRGLAERAAAAAGGGAPDGAVPHHLADVPEAERARVRAVFGEEMEDVYPASRMQAVMLAEYARDAARDGVYHPQQCHRLTGGALSVEALRHAIGQTVRRHAVLRTSFATASDGALLQVVRRNPSLSVDYLDLRPLSPDERERAVRERVARDLDTPFDPFGTTESLVRFVIFHREDGVADLLISGHHAVEDGWGNVHFVNTLFEAYADACDGRAVSSAPVANSYREFVALEAEILSSGEARAFWRDRVRALSPAWPARRGGAGGSQRECRVTRDAPAEVTAALREAAAREGVALKALYLSPFLDVVAALSGGEDSCAGVVWNGRSERLSDPLTALGLFWNLLPVARPSTASGGAVGRARAVHEDLLRADRFGRYPLAEIMAENGGREPFFATFNFLHFRHWAGPGVVRGGRVEAVYGLDRLHLPLNLAVSLAPQGEGGVLRVEYDRRFFDHADAAAALDGYLARLGALPLQHR